ncbi:MAG: nucleotidyltransferase family protein [Lachnoclostridium sp.]|nr:nucleotidyltransferase family protein [Lachnospira sp.]MCM1247954.1 nucleotidyltransferase family protein [Lachnoclostridium sp.]MCM1535348.1 nucleotidyltransferase family protein [Clostridium sp.]
MKREEELLLGLLKEELGGGDKNISKEELSAVNWGEFLALAQAHSVLSLLYGAFEKRGEGFVPASVWQRTRTVARQTVKQSYRLLFLSKYLLHVLEEARIPAVLLKGVATASFYPVPELRKAGDVDILLLEEERLSECCGLLEEKGFRVMENQPSLHHVVLQSEDGVEIEIHTMLAEPFDNQRMNQYMKKTAAECSGHICIADMMGISLPMLDAPCHAYELLLHMLQHFLRSGFGLKLLCDWVVFWNREENRREAAKYLSMVRESGLKGFSDMVSLASFRYLGLSGEAKECLEVTGEYDAEAFMEEILSAEEFGKSAPERMVALRGNGMADYVREFHHQMHLNFPKSGRCFLLWPFLWTVTLFRFLRNNRKVRKTSAFAVFKTAGQRGKIMKQIGLWKNR